MALYDAFCYGFLFNLPLSHSVVASALSHLCVEQEDRRYLVMLLLMGVIKMFTPTTPGFGDAALVVVDRARNHTA